MKKLLVVDDEKNIRTLYKEVFEKDGYEVILASTGKDCLEKIKNTSGLDLLVLDIKLPDINGMEILAELSKAKNKIPVILNSAYVGYENDPNAWLAEKYIIKSGDLSELKEKVKEVLGGKK